MVDLCKGPVRRLPTPLLEELRHYVQAGMANSLSALVRQSLEMRARQLREEELEKQFQEAARDPLFMADLHECMLAFDGLSGDGLDA